VYAHKKLFVSGILVVEVQTVRVVGIPQRYLLLATGWVVGSVALAVVVVGRAISVLVIVATVAVIADEDKDEKGLQSATEDKGIEGNIRV
jgi:hypothetical protein